jgi:UDP-N-acetylglucosamine 2-epimerase (non-hydrolysing)
MFVIGTRPEAIKLCPVIRVFRACAWANTVVVATGQHRELVDQVLTAFEVKANVDLRVMTEGQSLSDLTARLFERFGGCLQELRPDVVVGQGDTTSAFVAAVTAFYHGVPFAHVEAGLRTDDLRAPFPEEFNRRAAGLLTSVHFAPTASARTNLEREGVPSHSIFVTGNSVVDALYWIRDRRPPLPIEVRSEARLVLVTAHRRESFGDPLRQVFLAMRDLAERHRDLEFLYPVHPNPHVREAAECFLAGYPQIHLCGPLSYEQLVSALLRCDIVLTDSGGLQEEGPAVGKPVLVMRNVTERPEAVELGVAQLVGTERDMIVHNVSRLLTDPDHYKAMVCNVSPYGDGRASVRIRDVLAAYLQGGELGGCVDQFVEPRWVKGDRQMAIVS